MQQGGIPLHQYSGDTAKSCESSVTQTHGLTSELYCNHPGWATGGRLHKQPWATCVKEPFKKLRLRRNGTITRAWRSLKTFRSLTRGVAAQVLVLVLAHDVSADIHELFADPITPRHVLTSRCD